MFCTNDGKKTVHRDKFSCICDFTRFCFQISTFINRRFTKYRVKPLILTFHFNAILKKTKYLVIHVIPSFPGESIFELFYVIQYKKIP